eukprot:749217-Hanusia_phi.AAC.3
MRGKGTRRKGKVEWGDEAEEGEAWAAGERSQRRRKGIHVGAGGGRGSSIPRLQGEPRQQEEGGERESEGRKRGGGFA